MTTAKTYYDLLDISTDASEEEIQEAYRNRVRETHPDVSDDPNARKQMVELTKARDVLTDTQKRAEYDAEQNINGKHAQTTAHTVTESASTNRQHSNSNQSHSHQYNRSRTSQTGTQTTEAGTQNTGHAQSRSGQERNRRSRRRTRTRTRTQTSHTTSESGSLGSMSFQVYLQYLYAERDRLFREGCRELVMWILNICLLYPIWGLDRERVRSFIVSPTPMRLAAAFGLWWVIDWGGRQLSRSMISISNGEQVLLVGLCLFGSYLAHDLLSEYTGLFGNPPPKRFRLTGDVRFWPTIAANVLALGLFFWALTTGAPTGGMGLAFAAVLGFLVMTPIFGIVITIFVFVIGANVSKILLEKTMFVGPGIGLTASLLTLFTPAISQGGVTSLLGRSSIPLSTHPWIGSQLVGQAGPVYVGLAVNAVIGSLMLGSLFWSLVSMYRILTKVPWSDRFERGYHVRPGFWNCLVVLPFVVFSWMAIQHIFVVSLPIGRGITLFTIDGLMYLFGVLPIVLVSLYVFRRRAEPWIQSVL